MGLVISELTQVTLDTTPSLADLGGKPDIAVLSSGDRRRHRFFSRTFDGVPGIATLYCQKKQQGSSDIIAPSPSAAEFDALKSAVLTAAKKVQSVDGEPLKVLVDVSCLPRTSIAQVFAAINLIAQERVVRLKLTYSLAAYAPSPAIWATPNRTISPVHPAFSGWTSEGASAPLDVVVGLGYEKGKALGAVEYLEPRYRWICIPQSPETAYLREVMEHNKHLIDNSKGRVTNYEVLSPVETYFSLRSLVEGIAQSARPVLLPFGPKIFFALNLLVALSVEEAAVWHVSGERDDYDERHPSRHSVVLGCSVGSSE